eukprot:6177417-Pleurochrysis_carterae.AAC.6
MDNALKFPSGGRCGPPVPLSYRLQVSAVIIGKCPCLCSCSVQASCAGVGEMSARTGRTRICDSARGQASAYKGQVVRRQQPQPGRVRLSTLMYARKSWHSLGRRGWRG